MQRVKQWLPESKIVAGGWETWGDVGQRKHTSIMQDEKVLKI